MTYTLTVIRDFSALQTHKQSWDRLLPRSITQTIFQTFEWTESWWQCFGEKHELLALLLHEGETLVAIAPLMICNEKWRTGRRRVLRFIGTLNYSSDYCDFIIDRQHPKALDEIINWVLKSGLWDHIDLFNLPSESPHLIYLEGLLKTKGLRVSQQRLYDAPTRILGNEKEDQKALNKESVKRNLKYFNGRGNLVFKHIESAAERSALMDPFFNQHIVRWTSTPFPSLFLNPKEKEFYRILADSLSARGWLRFSVLTLNDAPIAFHFGFEYGGRYIWYKPSYDPKQAKAPGEVLLRYVMEYAIVKKLQEFDFTVGAEGYKYRFSNKIRSNHRLQVFGSQVDYLGFLGKQKIKSSIKAFQSGIRKLSELRARKEKEGT